MDVIRTPAVQRVYEHILATRVQYAPLHGLIREDVVRELAMPLEEVDLAFQHLSANGFIKLTFASLPNDYYVYAPTRTE